MVKRRDAFFRYVCEIPVVRLIVGKKLATVHCTFVVLGIKDLSSKGKRK